MFHLYDTRTQSYLTVGPFASRERAEEEADRHADHIRAIPESTLAVGPGHEQEVPTP